MNNWTTEYMAEYQRQQVIEEMKQIRLEELARAARVRCPNRFERMMLRLANWMISKGRQLRERHQSAPGSCGSARRVASQTNG